MLSPLRRDRGNAMVEYVILLAAIAILLIAVVYDYGQTLEGEWTGGEPAQLEDSVATNLDGGDPSGDCNYYYNPSTGRWHDPDTHLFISFDDAESAGCS